MAKSFDNWLFLYLAELPQTLVSIYILLPALWEVENNNQVFLFSPTEYHTTSMVVFVEMPE